MEKKETAEQKLLKIIENPKADSEPKPAAGGEVAKEVASKVKNSGLPALSISSILIPLTGLFKGRLSSASEIAFGPKEINRILSLTIMVVILCFAANLFSGVRLLKNKVTFKMDTKIAQGENSFMPQGKAISEYLDSIHKRNIFQPYEKKEVKEEENIPVETRHIVAMAKTLKLVGISWLDSPDSASAMIEDTQSGTTYFLKEGEKINDVTIKNIYADRVIIAYEGEELAIKL